MAYKFQLGVAQMSGSLTQEGDITVSDGGDGALGNVSSSGDGRFMAIDLDSTANVLTKTGLGSTVLASSLTSVGTLSSLTTTGVISGSGDLRLGAGAGIDIGGQANVLSQATLGSTVVASSLTSVGTLTSLDVGNVTSTGILSASGDLTLGAGKSIDIAGTANVYNLASLGSTVLASSLTSVGTLAGVTASSPIVAQGGYEGTTVTVTGVISGSGDLTLGAGAGIDIGGQANVLSQATLGSTVLASSLTSVGTLTSLDVGNVTSTGNISGSGKFDVGDGDLRFSGVSMVATSDELNVMTGFASGTYAQASSQLCFIDVATGEMRKESNAHFLAAIAGGGLSVSSNKLVVDGQGTPTGIVDANATLVEGFNFGTKQLNANRVWTLPASPTAGDTVRIKAPSYTGSNYITVTGSGVQTIDGESSIRLETAGASVSLILAAANNWAIF
jgi:hypothetical protein